MEKAQAWMESLKPHIICNGSASDEEWLAQRVGLITGSKIPTIVGVGYKGPLDILNEFKHPDEAKQVEMYSPLWCKMKIGSLAEKPIGETAHHIPDRPFAYEPISDVPRLIRHPEIPWAACSPDGLAIGSGGEKVLIEIKHHKMSMMKTYETEDGGELVPSKFEAQNLWNQFCTGADVGLMVSWFGEDVLFRIVERDEAVIVSMVRRAEMFLEAVKTDNALLMMEVIENATAMNKAMNQIFRYSSGSELTIDDPQLDSDIAKCIEVKAKIKELGVDKDQLESAIKARIGASKRMETAGYKISWGQAKGKEKFDSKRFIQDHAGLAKEYTQDGLPYRTGLRLTQRKEKKNG